MRLTSVSHLKIDLGLADSVGNNRFNSFAQSLTLTLTLSLTLTLALTLSLTVG